MIIHERCQMPHKGDQGKRLPLYLIVIAFMSHTRAIKQRRAEERIRKAIICRMIETG